jgi:signal transduction histidine kinase
MRLLLAERATTDAERRTALVLLRAGLTRATHLVEQLLTQGREEPGVAERSFAPVNLVELGRSIVGAHAAIAAARGVDLGLAMVKRIAERHDAHITLGPGLAGPSGEGLGVTLRFPAFDSGNRS